MSLYSGVRPFPWSVRKGYGNFWDRSQQRQESSDKHLFPLASFSLNSFCLNMCAGAQTLPVSIRSLQSFSSCSAVKWSTGTNISSFSGSSISDLNLGQYGIHAGIIYCTLCSSFTLCWHFIPHQQLIKSLFCLFKPDLYIENTVPFDCSWSKYAFHRIRACLYALVDHATNAIS